MNELDQTHTDDAPSPGEAGEVGNGNAPSTRLHGPLLVVARVLWLVLLVGSLATFVVGIPDYLNGLTNQAGTNNALLPGAVDALRQIGVGLDTFALVSVVLGCVIILVTLGISLVLIWRRGDDWMVMLVSLFLIVYVIGNISASDNTTPAFSSALVVIIFVLQQVVISAIFYAGFLLFPSGRFVPRWSWTLLVAVVAWNLVTTLTNMEILDGWLVLGYPIFYGAALVNIIYRYRRASNPVQQQQTKWVVVGLVASLLGNQLFWLPSGLTPLGNTLYAPISYLVYQLVLLAVPITFFIAVQRYRLYDIDTIINRALVYGALTAILALVYVGGVVGLQATFSAVAGKDEGQPSPLLIVVTTLVIAALVGPLRGRLQRAVDRRFYRSKYDATQTMAAFSATLRNEMDLERVGDELLGAVDETLRPARAILWLRPTTAGKREA